MRAAVRWCQEDMQEGGRSSCVQTNGVMLQKEQTWEHGNNVFKSLI
jgi:catabolite regulation protein CreA